MKKITLYSLVPDQHGKKKRLDHILVKIFFQYSREILRKWIINNQVLVNQTIINKPSKKIVGGEYIFIQTEIISSNFYQPENIKINVIYEDKDIFIINKSSNLVVHPAPGHNSGTLLNALLFIDNNLKFLPRAGIVHRLDKNTTGLMVVARNIEAYNHLVTLISHRKVFREYKAIVLGSMLSGGTINESISRHPINRKKMMVNHTGKNSVTHYRIIKKFKCYTYIRVILETGRTHQIRVHMSYINHPIVGDKLYMIKRKNLISSSMNKKFNTLFSSFPRQALHATQLCFIHPTTNKVMNWKIDVPKDMKELLCVLYSLKM
ncbi:23S rRNA pseudouridine(1911/1915/1917) synthase RluD [Buchnera aphidicola]|uniref:23S rRNA pseudouridine(1911/1915/1917) synthase RluD n=1 Tax=Buchnera aphidicola TaxID=9 RepID=UPI003463B1F5